MPAEEAVGLVTVFGGTGFVGRYLVRALARRGYRVRVAVRNPALATVLQPMGSVGQIQPLQANLRFPQSVADAVAGADVVVNLVGILAERRPQTFAAVHVEGARAVAEASRAAGVRRLVHLSALGADANSASRYQRSKAAGEAAVRAAYPAVAILRPSVVFGVEDTFFNRIAGLARMLPVMPMIGAETRFQPVFVGDVAEAAARLVEGSAEPQIYELGGPEIFTEREILQLTLREIGRRRALLPVPFWAARAKAAVLQRLPGRLLTVDEVRQLASDKVVGDAAIEEARTLPGLGIVPTGVAGVLPSYLVRYRQRGQFSRSLA